jgi:hypothetical protein
VPFDYALMRTARRQGVPVWVLEGYPVHEPPLEWIIRILEYDRIEASVSVTHEHDHDPARRPPGFGRWYGLPARA